MSHFVLLVIGDDVEGQLEPYNENISVDPYWEDAAFQPSDHWAFNMILKEGGITADISLEDYCEVVNKRYAEDEFEKFRVDGGVLQRQSTYNPKSQWDWWVVGGRWSDILLKFDGTTCDEGQILEIDWAGMELVAAQRAERTIDDVLTITTNQKMPKPWSFFRDKYGVEDIAVARDKYHAQPVVKAIQAHEHLRLFLDDLVEYYCLDQPDPKAAFIQNAIDGTPSCFAVLKNGEWIAKGRMGMFGMSSDDVEEGVWRKQVKELIKANPGEYITVVDCHI